MLRQIEIDGIADTGSDDAELAQEEYKYKVLSEESCFCLRGSKARPTVSARRSINLKNACVNSAGTAHEVQTGCAQTVLPVHEGERGQTDGVSQVQH